MGLLDILNTDDGRFGLGLLAAAAPRTDGAGFGQRLNEAVGSVDQFKRQKLLARLQELQAKEAEAAMADKQAQRARQEKIRSGMGQFFTPGQSAISSLAGDPESGILPSAGRPATAPSFDAGGAAQFLAQQGEYEKALPMLQSLQPKREKLGAGEAVYENGKKLYENPKEKSLPGAVQEYQFAQGQGYKGSFVDFQLDQKNAGASKVAVDMRDPTAVAKAAMGFQNDYRAATKSSYARAQAYESMMQAAADPSAKGDLTMVYSFIRALDPDSVVREGEVKLVEANRSIPDQIKGYAQKLATGKNLLPEERQDLIKQARTLTETDYKRSRNDVKAYRDNAGRLGLDPDLYAPDPYAGFKPQGAKPATGNAMESLPTANASNKGRKIRDTTTGKILVSNGMTWTEQK